MPIRPIFILCAMAASVQYALCQVVELPIPDRTIVLDAKGQPNAQMPVEIKFSPDDNVIISRFRVNGKNDALTRVDLNSRAQASIEIPRIKMSDGKGNSISILTDRSLYAISNSSIQEVTFADGKLSAVSHKLGWGNSEFTSTSRASLVRMDKGALRLFRITEDDAVEYLHFDTEKKEAETPISLGKFDKGDLHTHFYDSGSEIICGVSRPKSPATHFLSVNPADDKPELKPLFTVKDGCISLQVQDDYYIVGTSKGVMTFLPKKGKDKPLDAQVLQMCIQQVVVHKDGDGVYTCLVCGADEGNSFAVARVNTKTGTIQSKIFKIAAKPAKVLAAFSNDGKTFALIDYNLKLSLFKTEQFKNLE